MESLKISLTKTTKNKQGALCNKFLYYHKRDNPISGTVNWVCSKIGECSSSITTKDEYVIKINGKKVQSASSFDVDESSNDSTATATSATNASATDLDLIQASHNHSPPTETELLVIEMTKSLKEKVKDSSKSIREHYQEAQTDFIRATGSVDMAAAHFPQLSSIQNCSLFITSSRVPKTTKKS